MVNSYRQRCGLGLCDRVGLENACMIFGDGKRCEETIQNPIFTCASSPLLLTANPSSLTPAQRISRTDRRSLVRHLDTASNGAKTMSAHCGNTAESLRKEK